MDLIDSIDRIDGMKSEEGPAFDPALMDLLRRSRRVEVDADWADLAALWDIRADTTYLNHGSFGPSPRPVREARDWWRDRCEEQPMDFFLRWLEPALEAARSGLARFCGTTTRNLVFADNATWAMNVVARSFPLGAGDEVLLTDHEYGAVSRIWNEACDQAGAKTATAVLPLPFTTAGNVVDAIVSAITPRTRLVVVSHITSPTGITLPVEAICRAVRERGVAACIDGPHALVEVDVELDRLDCDFYTASCHKWLCAPLGTGFLYVHPRQQNLIRPLIRSWGRLLPAVPQRWDEEFTWPGTREPSAWLAIPAAIRFFQELGIETFRNRTHWLAQQARTRLEAVTGCAALVPDDSAWYQSMTEVPLPPGDWSGLQQKLWENHRIEIPVVSFAHRWLIRVSSHLYNDRGQTDSLVEALSKELQKAT